MKIDVETRLQHALDAYFYEEDPVLHRNAIKELLEETEPDTDSEELINGTKEYVEDFFFGWEAAAEFVTIDAADRKGLKALGELSRELYNKKHYKQLHELYYGLMFKHFVSFYYLEEREDFDEMTNEDLHTKKLIPSEIHLPYILLELPTLVPDFNWDRSDEVMRQHLACLIVCFNDIQDFFDAESPSVEYADGVCDDCKTCPTCHARMHKVKIQRNEPCPCGSGKKYKKCCLK